VMEPWDGPAALAAYDGRWCMAGLDRNGLRPMRYALSSDGILAVGSETGMCPMDEKTIIKKGALKPGRMIAVDLDEIYRPLSHHFRQNFSQVTNPPIDPLRETRVMGLKTRFRNLRNILADGEAQTREMLVLESPVLTNGMFERFEKYVGKKALTIDCTFPMPDITVCRAYRRGRNGGERLYGAGCFG